MVNEQEKNMVQVKWKVAEAPTGRYRSFEKRGWPSASFKGTDRSAIAIYCDDSYTPQRARDGMHGELMVCIADYSVEGPGFKWRTLKARFKTLDEAKAAGINALDKHSSFLPKDL
jgi:hypothetical protein